MTKGINGGVRKAKMTSYPEAGMQHPSTPKPNLHKAFREAKKARELATKQKETS